MAENNKKNLKKARLVDLMHNSHTNLHFRSSSRNPSRQSQGGMRKSVASSLSEKSTKSTKSSKSAKSRCSAASHRENRSGTDSRATRTSIDSKGRSDTTKATKEPKAKSTDSKTTYPNRKSSLTTVGQSMISGQSLRSSTTRSSTTRSSKSRSVTPGKVTGPSTKTSTTQTRRYRKSRGIFRGVPSAYSFFVKSYFSEFRKKNPDEKLPFITLSRRCADKWHSLPNPIKQEFYRMAQHFNTRKLAITRKSAQRLCPIFIRRRISGPARSVTTATTKSILSKRNTHSGDTSCTSTSSTRSAPKKRSRPRLLQPNKYRRLFSMHSSTPGRHNRFQK